MMLAREGRKMRPQPNRPQPPLLGLPREIKASVSSREDMDTLAEAKGTPPGEGGSRRGGAPPRERPGHGQGTWEGPSPRPSLGAAGAPASSDTREPPAPPRHADEPPAELVPRFSLGNKSKGRPKAMQGTYVTKQNPWSAPGAPLERPRPHSGHGARPVET